MTRAWNFDYNPYSSNTIARPGGRAIRNTITNPRGCHLNGRGAGNQPGLGEPGLGEPGLGEPACVSGALASAATAAAETRRQRGRAVPGRGGGRDGYRPGHGQGDRRKRGAGSRNMRRGLGRRSPCSWTLKINARSSRPSKTILPPQSPLMNKTKTKRGKKIK